MLNVNTHHASFCLSCLTYNIYTHRRTRLCWVQPTAIQPLSQHIILEKTNPTKNIQYKSRRLSVDSQGYGANILGKYLCTSATTCPVQYPCISQHRPAAGPMTATAAIAATHQPDPCQDDTCQLLLHKYDGRSSAVHGNLQAYSTRVCAKPDRLRTTSRHSSTRQQHAFPSPTSWQQLLAANKAALN